MKRVLDEINRLRLKRGWSMYELGVHSGISQSTISTWYRKNQQPSIASLEKICKGLGMTLSQFFAGEDEALSLTPQQRELLDSWSTLSAQQQKLLLAFIDARIETH